LPVVFALLAAGVPAWAHLPHDRVDALLAPANLDASVPWFLLFDPEQPTLMRSDDGGETWEMFGGSPTRDFLVGGAMLEDGTPVLYSDEGYWWSDDGGETWDFADFEGIDVLGSGGDEIFVSTGTETWVGRPGEELERFTPLQGVQFVRLSGDQLSVVDGAGNLWSRRQGVWSQLGSPGVPLIAGVAGEGVAYGADGSGEVWALSKSSWTPCAELVDPPPESQAPAEVWQMALDGDRLLVVDAWRAPYVSDDGCQSWDESRLSPLITTYTGNGAATSSAESFTSLAAADGQWWVGGWAGLARTRDAGLSWTEVPLLPPDYAETVQFSPHFADDHTVLAGSYTGGLLITDDGGESFVAPGLGLSDGTVMIVRAAGWDDTLQDVFAVVEHSPMKSHDGGLSWVPMETADPVFEIALTSSPEAVWVFSADVGVERSDDRAESWQVVDLPLDAPTQTLAGVTLADGTDMLYLLYSNPSALYGSDDGGASWAALHEVTGGRPSEYEIGWWPPSGAERLFFTADDGLWSSSDRGETWADVWPEPADPPRQIAGADDGTLFVSTTTARIYRSDDGGETWTSLGVQLPGTVRELKARPGFEHGPDLIASTPAGHYVIQHADGDEPVSGLWGGLMRIDTNLLGYFLEQGCEREVHDESASLQTLLGLPEGCGVGVWVRGHTLRAWGIATGAEAVDVLVDGLPITSFGAAEVSYDELFEISGLEDTWHWLELVTRSGDGAYLDAVEGKTEALTLGVYEPADSDTGRPDTEDTSGRPDTGDTHAGHDTARDGPEDPSRRCGCAAPVGGAAPGAMVLWALTLAGFRRSTATPTRPG